MVATNIDRLTITVTTPIRTRIRLWLGCKFLLLGGWMLSALSYRAAGRTIVADACPRLVFENSFKTLAASILLALCLPAFANAQALPTQGERQAADVISYGTAAVSVALDARDAWRSSDRTHALQLFAVRSAVTWGAASIAKGLAHSDRPCAPQCGIDRPDTSFYSMHTAYAFQGGYRRWMLGISTGTLRVGAGKHHVVDVFVGAIAGLLTSEIR